MVTTGHIVRIKNKLNAEPGLNDFVTMAVDADGLGAGVYDRLVELGHSVGEIRGGLPAIKPEDFVNRRSEWYWNLRERFEDGEIDIDPARRGAGAAARVDQVDDDVQGPDRRRVEGRDAASGPAVP